jgi:hypothetical protein
MLPAPVFRLRALRLSLIGLCAASVAWAYVPAVGAIFRHMLSGRDEQRLSSARVDGTLILFGGAASEVGAPGEVQGDAGISLRLPGRCRLDASSADGSKVAVVDVNGQQRSEGPTVTALGRGLSEVCALFGARSAGDGQSALEAHLKARGIDTQRTSLARFGGQVAYVVGAPGETDPQFWVFKDSFLPARMRWTEGGIHWDVRFVDYNSPAGDWFPRVVEVARNGERQARFTTLSGDPRATLPDRLF